MSEGVTAQQPFAERILVIRGQRVMLDADLEELYGVPTKRFNEQVKRNLARFPLEFMFQLTAAEKQEVVANCDHLTRQKFSPHAPYAFTEHGAILNSPKAVAVGAGLPANGKDHFAGKPAPTSQDFLPRPGTGRRHRRHPPVDGAPQSQESPHRLHH